MKALSPKNSRTSARLHSALFALTALLLSCGGDENGGTGEDSSNQGSGGSDEIGTSSGGAGSGASNAGGSSSGGSSSGGVGAGGAGDGGASAGGVTSGGASSGGGSGDGGSGGLPGSGGSTCEGASTEANKAIAEDALVRLFSMNDESAFYEYWADPYLQHNPVAASGVDAFWSFFESQVQSGNPLYTLERLIGECDLVVTQGTYTGTGIVFDMLRVEDGKLVEHWDSSVVSPGPNESSHTALDGPVPPVPGGPIPVNTSANKQIVIAFTESVLIAGDALSANDYMSETLVEHDADGSDGRDAFLQYRADESLNTTQIHHIVADGDFVFTMTEGTVSGQPYGFYDLYFLEEGLITHHWGGRRQVPATTASGLPIF